MNAAAAVGLSLAVALLTAAAGLYLARVRVPRPPVGVYVPADVAVICAGVVLAPLLYVSLPGAVVATLFGVVLCAAVQFTVAPVLPGWPSWLAALLPAGVTVALLGHPVGVRVCTDVLLAVAVVGIANLWTQSGMRSAHVAALALVLCCYDLVATTLTHLTVRFAAEVLGRPFAPLFQLTGGREPVAVGLGDLLLLVLFPLVAAKAFGRTPAVVAAAVGVAVTSLITVLFACRVLTAGFPLLTALGPLIVVQHLYWTRRAGAERTTAAWRGTAPPPPAGDPVADELDTALAVRPPAGSPAGAWIAVRSGRVVGTGTSGGRARRDARERGEEAPVVVRQV